MGSHRHPKFTRTSPEDAILALDQTWAQVVKYSTAIARPADISSLGILISHWAIETNWGNDMLNYNWINIPKDPKDIHCFTVRAFQQNYNGIMMATREDIRAYDTLAEGALDMLLWLSTKYAAWDYLLDGDVGLYLDTLESFGCLRNRFTANYKYAIKNIADKIKYEHPTRPDVILPGDSPEEQELFNQKERESILASVADCLSVLSGGNAYNPNDT